MGKKIASRQDLEALRQKARSEVDLRTGPKEIQITVHMGTCGIAAGGREVLSELADALSDITQEKVDLRKSGCLGRCDQEPMMTVTEQSGAKFLYGNLDKKKVREIVQEHILGGQPVRNYIVES
ncbi:MAG TPA: (2Fe-2S) ferredoxin domain-containing protein [Thermoguttaceae bacterium]|nr:(2Fe-2S) ferredoxin domain-containing protein [Thermoguttaceae bacterium]